MSRRGLQAGGRGRAEQARAGDAFQRPLRSRFRQQLTRSVDMTSDVKGWEQLFDVCLMFFPVV